MKNLLFILVIITLIIILTISIFNIIKWKFDSNKTNEEINNIQKNINVEEVEDTDNTEIVEPVEEIPKENPYWDYIKMNMLNVDFSELKKINNNVKGWIQVKGTNINYPFVQANDNKYYLTHSFDKSWNSAVWLFLDYINNYTNNKNTIIYAGRTDKTMFGSLKKVLSNEWLINSNNYIIKISTEKENSLWQIFSIYHIPTTSDYLETNFSSDTEYLDFLNMLLTRSAYNFNTSINSNDNILTLSTCYNNSDKMVVHAKLRTKDKLKFVALVVTDQNSYFIDRVPSILHRLKFR